MAMRGCLWRGYTARFGRTGRAMGLAVLVLVAGCAARGESARGAPLLRARTPGSFWDTPRRGTNHFARPMDAQWLAAARELGIGWVRIAPAFWPAAERDYLLGDADHYDGLQPDDLALLRAQLDLARAHGMSVVFSMVSLPGARWRQHHGGIDDERLWQDRSFREQAIRFWTELVQALGSHPALVGINLLNEPRPLDPSALCPFYAEAVAAIREHAPLLPILLEPGPDAEPAAIAALSASTDPNVLYDVHFYEPWPFVTYRVNRGRFSYPGLDEESRTIDRAHLASVLAHVVRWQHAHGVPSSRVVLGEFGIDRRIGGAAAWLADVIALAEQSGWHWAFYAYRDWHATDYELGPAPPPAEYWDAEERGEPHPLPRVASPMLDAIRSGLRRTGDSR